MIRGRALLTRGNDEGEQAPSLRYVHHIWLSGNRPPKGEAENTIPIRFAQNIYSWRIGVPGCILVEWLNVDAFLLVSERNKASFFYDDLKTPVERSDYLRMLILHTFGGEYVDVDMEAFQSVVDYFDFSRPVNLLYSPLFSELFQSCFLVAHEKNYPFWIDVANRIEYNVLAMSKPSHSVSILMSNPLTRYITRMAITVFLTGPATLDKCIAKAHLTNQYVDAFACLSKSLYCGPIAVHHEAGSWTYLSKFVEFKTRVRMLLKFDRFSLIGTLMMMWVTWLIIGVCILACIKHGKIF